MNIIVPGELLTTVENISNLLPAFNFKGEGWISFRSTPAAAGLEEADEFVWVDWEYAYRISPNGKPRLVKVTSIANMGSNIIHCFVLQSCIWDVLLVTLVVLFVLICCYELHSIAHVACIDIY